MTRRRGELPGDVNQREGASRGGFWVVIGATGGSGVTTVASALALTLRAHRPTFVDLDLESGDAHEGWAAPAHRTIQDLVPVIGEMRSGHLDLVAYPHASGVDLLLSASRPGAGGTWPDAAIGELIGCARERGPVVADVGRNTRSAAALRSVPDARWVIVTPPTPRGARNAERLAAWTEAVEVTVCINGDGGRDTVPARLVFAACAPFPAFDVPRREREAAALRSGRPGVVRRRGIAWSVAAGLGIGHAGG